MRFVFIVIIFLSGCQATTYSDPYAHHPKPTVPSDVFNTSVCNMSIYDSESCYSRVTQNIRREKQRRLYELQKIDADYRGNISGYIDVFYASYPSINSKGENVPYNLFNLTQIIPSPVGKGGSIFVFRNAAYSYGLLWLAPESLNTRLVKLGSPIFEFLDCAMLISNDALNDESLKDHYSLHEIHCD